MWAQLNLLLIMRQDNFLFHMAFHIQNRKLAVFCLNPYGVFYKIFKKGNSNGLTPQQFE
jgi:hypothetical protein